MAVIDQMRSELKAGLKFVFSNLKNLRGVDAQHPSGAPVRVGDTVTLDITVKNDNTVALNMVRGTIGPGHDAQAFTPVVFPVTSPAFPPQLPWFRLDPSSSKRLFTGFRVTAKTDGSGADTLLVCQVNGAVADLSAIVFSDTEYYDYPLLPA